MQGPEDDVMLMIVEAGAPVQPDDDLATPTHTRAVVTEQTGETAFELTTRVRDELEQLVGRAGPVNQVVLVLAPTWRAPPDTFPHLDISLVLWLALQAGSLSSGVEVTLLASGFIGLERRRQLMEIWSNVSERLADLQAEVILCIDSAEPHSGVYRLAEIAGSSASDSPS